MTRTATEIQTDITEMIEMIERNAETAQRYEERAAALRRVVAGQEAWVGELRAELAAQLAGEKG